MIDTKTAILMNQPTITNSPLNLNKDIPHSIKIENSVKRKTESTSQEINKSLIGQNQILKFDLYKKFETIDS